MSAINKHKWLPAYIVVVLDSDIIDFIGFANQGVSEIIGNCLSWIIKEFKDAISTKEEVLPTKAKKKGEPFFYWMVAPQHDNFRDRVARTKFNLVLESIMKQEATMRVAKVKEFWDVADSAIANKKTGMLMELGHTQYWQAIDATLRFNISKHEQFLAKTDDRPVKHKPQQHMHIREENRNEMQEFFQRRKNSEDRRLHQGHVQNNNQFLLPRLGHRRH